MGPRALKAAIKRYMPRALVVRRLKPSGGNSVLLTFDDGPDPEITPAVLDRLDAHNARALFFVVGRRIKNAPHLLGEIIKRGHLIGNHSHLHRRSYVRPGPPQVGVVTYYHDLQRCQERIKNQIGTKPTLFRPPGGRLVAKTLLACKASGLKCVNWSQEVRDWNFKTLDEGTRGGQTLLDQITARDIVLLHDDNAPVLSLLDVLLPGLRSKGLDLLHGIEHI